MSRIITVTDNELQRLAERLAFALPVDRTNRMVSVTERQWNVLRGLVEEERERLNGGRTGDGEA